MIVPITLLLFYFFRDPERNIEPKDHLVLSACDGTVMEVETVREEDHLQGQALRISVFLSIFNVHVQRAPLAGQVLQIEHHPGRFLFAFRQKAAQENDRIDLLMRTSLGDVLVQQIAGALARRCVCYARQNQSLAIGERFGMIRFGSRVDLYLPENMKPLVQKGDRVRAGITAVACCSDG